MAALSSRRRRTGWRTPKSNKAVVLAGGQTPIYVQLVTLFQRRIETDEWPVDSQIPTLEQLSAELGVARATIRHAIGFLEKEGLIGRYRGRGSFVLRKPEIEVWHEIPTDWQTLVEVEPEFKMEWIKCHKANKLPVASHPGGELADSYQFMSRIHRRNGIPYLIGTAHVASEIFKSLGRNGMRTTLPLRALQKHGIGRGEQTIQVITADLETAHRLDISVNSPVVVVMRSIFSKQNVLLYDSVGFHRSDFVRIRSKLL